MQRYQLEFLLVAVSRASMRDDFTITTLYNFENKRQERSTRVWAWTTSLKISRCGGGMTARALVVCGNFQCFCFEG